MGFINRARSFLGLGGPVADPGARPRTVSEYMRGGRNVTFAKWQPALRDADVTVQNAWDKAAARLVDVIHNSGWLAGAIDQATANTVGTGLRLKAQPENTLFGMDDKAAQAWARVVEQRFGLWANDKNEFDIEGRRTFGQMQAIAFKGWFGFGEIIAEIPWRKRAGLYGTKVRLIPPHKLTRKNDDLRRMKAGVVMDADGYPIAYEFTVKSGGQQFEQEVQLPARDRFGRARIVHVFDGLAGQVRGISPLVPALQVARQFDQLSDATLMNAIVSSVFAASITAQEPTEEVLAGMLTPQEQARMAATGTSAWEAWFEAQAGWYDQSTIDVGVNGRVAHLFPGQKLEFHTSGHPTSNYKDYSNHLLREIARCMGMAFESMTGDYTAATYSSVRMEANEIFEVTKYRRTNIVAPFCQPVYEAWLEEEVEAGRVEFPGGIEAFLANRAAACRADWRGAPKPQADDLKTAKAHQIYKTLGVMSDAMIAQDLGVDIEDVYMQRASEKAMREGLGLNEPMDAVTGQDLPEPPEPEDPPEDTP
jgi:lambda family phage portal protein